MQRQDMRSCTLQFYYQHQLTTTFLCKAMPLLLP